MEMASYILKVLRTELIVVFSWGFHNPVAVQDGLRFLVNGYLHQGWVEVLYDEGMDLFKVRTLENGAVKEETDGVYVESLVYVIDRMVETK